MKLILAGNCQAFEGTIALMYCVSEKAYQPWSFAGMKPVLESEKYSKRSGYLICYFKQNNTRDSDPLHSSVSQGIVS